MPQRKTKPRPEKAFNIIYKLEIIVSGSANTYQARVQYNTVPSDTNECKTSTKRGTRKPLNDALNEWKSEYRHKIKSINPLNINDIISSKNLIDPKHITKLLHYVTVINHFLSQNQPLTDDQSVINAPSNRPPAAATIAQLQVQNELLKSEVEKQKLQNKIHEQQHNIADLENKIEFIEREKQKMRKKLSYYQKENEKNKVCIYICLYTKKY